MHSKKPGSRNKKTVAFQKVDKFSVIYRVIVLNEGIFHCRNPSLTEVEIFT